MHNFFINDYLFFIKNFGKWLKTLEHDQISVITPTPKSTPEYHCIPVSFERRKYRLNQLFKSFLTYIRIVKKKEVNVFITIVPICLGMIVTFLKRVPGVFYFTGLGTIFTSANPVSQLIQRILIVCFKIFMDTSKNLIIVQNQTDIGILKDKIKVKKASIKKINGCGIDTDKYVYAPRINFNEPLKILIPARLIKEKGIMECVEASEILEKNHFKHEFIFSSDIDPGNPSSLSREQIEQFSKYPNLRFTGFVDDIIKLYREVDIICLPSYREGLPNVLLEAQAIGRLTIASDVPGCRDVIEQNKTGFLFPVKNGEAIASTLQEIQKQRFDIKRILDNARNNMENIFSDKIIIDELSNLMNYHFKSIIDRDNYKH